MRKVVFAATQMACCDNINENIEKAEILVRKAKDQGANIVLLQEIFSTLYFCQEYDFNNFKLAEEEEDNIFLYGMSELSKELEVVLPISFFEKAGNVFFNSVVIFDADGKRLGKYRKTHIPDDPGYYEKFYFSPGDTGFRVWDTKFCKIGVGICWDQWFPEAARCMCLMGAEALLYPTAIGTYAVPEKELIDEPYNSGHWTNVMCGHGAANMVPVIASNRIGREHAKETAIDFYGHSFISNQYGDVEKQAGPTEETVLVATFDMDELREERVNNVFFRDRRPEMYQKIMTLDGENRSV